ncbi:MAG TPA: TIGR00341 family protein [Methanoregulaceae archaeon]|nr:MAG: TIGR00341 family protein [Methanolinea sp.]HON82488.1 TIGR00341 family protein [Methanoregulaceae archaeon]HPD11068.1 TIGR00341 family protein [Methanoregulaceae archaeon]HRT16115.1 TIGR00341 family protein [Methanoregulaceae archaeon]HRU31679.1 TIGR00341 family protein [Methanoregulaceae archaeon]
MLSEWVEKNRFDPGYLPVMEKKLFFEGELRLRSMTNYIVLLTLATVIATYGVISGSTATVIGAMIIAPLMTPIMATTLAIVMGSSTRMTQSVLVVIASTIYVIVLAVLLSLFISPVIIGFGTNTEITTRISPDLLALLVALASGAAGAFAISREDIGDTLPGVAIAISLIPPLSVTGIALSKARWLDAGGALLLFTTNFLAIILAGGAVLYLSGINMGWVSSEENVRRKHAVEIAVVAVIIVGLLLGFNGYRTLEHERDLYLARSSVEEWLQGTPYHIREVSLQYLPEDMLALGPAAVTVAVAGSGDIPDIERLAGRMEENLGYPVTLELRVRPEEIERYPSPKGVSP